MQFGFFQVREKEGKPNQYRIIKSLSVSMKVLEEAQQLLVSKFQAGAEEQRSDQTKTLLERVIAKMEDIDLRLQRLENTAA